MHVITPKLLRGPSVDRDRPAAHHSCPGESSPGWVSDVQVLAELWDSGLLRLVRGGCHSPGPIYTQETQRSPGGREQKTSGAGQVPRRVPLWIRCSSTSQWPNSAATPKGVTPKPSLRWTLPPCRSSRATRSLRPCLAASCIADHCFPQAWPRLQLCLSSADTTSREPCFTAGGCREKNRGQQAR